jgi:hypothetical protein
MLAAAAVAVAVPLWARADSAAEASCRGHHGASCMSDGGASCPGHDGAGCPGHGEAGCPGHHGGGHAAAMTGAGHFDPKTVTQVQGTVETLDSAGRRGHGVRLVLAVGSDKLPVMVGPDFYLAQQGWKLAPGDRLEVKGSRLTFDDAPVLVAQELRKGDQVLTLRDADGAPRWAGPRAGK